MTSATITINRSSKGFNPAGPHYTGIAFKKGFVTPQTAIDRAKFADCPTGNPTYAPTITSAEYRESVAAYKASGVQRPFCPSTLKTPDNDSRIQHEHNLARDRKAAAKVTELAEHTCVDCGLDQMGNGQTIYLRTVESKGTWLEQPSVQAVLCTSCYDARKAVMHAAEEAARLAAHCTACKTVLVSEPGLCRFCLEAEGRAADDGGFCQACVHPINVGQRIKWLDGIRYHELCDPTLPPSHVFRAALEGEASIAGCAECQAELDRLDAQECALTHTEESPRGVLVGAIAGASDQLCEYCDRPAEWTLSGLGYCAEHYPLCNRCFHAAKSYLDDGSSDATIIVAAVEGQTIPHDCLRPESCKCTGTHGTPEPTTAEVQARDMARDHNFGRHNGQYAEPDCPWCGGTVTGHDTTGRCVANYIGCDFLRTQPDGQPASTCNRPASYRARRVHGHSDLTLNCCPDCVDRAKRRGYELAPLDAPEPPSGPAINSRPPMSPELRRARAINKANAQRAHVRALPGRPGFYLVRSATDPHERYVVSVNAQTGAIECSCKAGSEYRQPCWHAERLRSRLLRESRKVAA